MFSNTKPCKAWQRHGPGIPAEKHAVETDRYPRIREDMRQDR